MTKPVQKYDIETLRAVIGRVNLIRTMSPEPKIPEKHPELQAAYYAGWDDCCAVIGKLLKKMEQLG